MNRLTCIILDDEPMAVALLSKYVEKIATFRLLKATTNAFEVLELVANNPVDVVFIDIQMPELNGLQLMEMMGSKTKFVITSAYSEYALQGYEHNVIDYLLKPVSFERFYKTVLKIQDLFQKAVLDNVMKTEEKQDDILFVKTDGKHVKINLSELLFVEGLKDYLYLYLKTEKLIVLDTLKEFENRLPQEFMRIHKSYIIRLGAIETIERNRVFIGDKIIPVGDTYKLKFQEWMKEFM